MTSSFTPRLDVLPLAQRQLWPQLRAATDLGFVLYGGTAIALRLGHRASIDFDLFSARPLDRDAIAAALPFVGQATALQDQRDSWTLLTPELVKLSFFGNLTMGRTGTPATTDDGVLMVASLDDLMTTNLKVILQRAEAKDYRDIAALLGAGVSLARGLAAARKIFGPNFQPSEALKALVYFGDGDLATLSDAEKIVLGEAVKTVRDLPQVELASRELSLTPGDLQS